MQPPLAWRTFGTGYVTFGASNTPTLDLGGHSATVAGLIGAGSNGVVTNSVAATTSTLTLDGVYGETYAGSIQNGSGTLALTENLNNATETVTLTGANTYTGATNVTSGNLQVGNGTVGTLNNSNITVAPGMTIGFDEPTGQHRGWQYLGRRYRNCHYRHRHRHRR